MQERPETHLPFQYFVGQSFDPWREALGGYFPIVAGDYSRRSRYQQQEVIEESGGNFMLIESWENGAKVTKLENAGNNSIEVAVRLGTRIIEATINKYRLSGEEELIVRSKGMEPNASWTTFIRETRKLPPQKFTTVI